MTCHMSKQLAYAAKRRAVTGLPPLTPSIVSRPLRVIGQPDMQHPPMLIVRADMVDEVAERLRAGGLEFADGAAVAGGFW